ncbi:MAG TPA: hydroxymethylglutaryl-CoA lyase [Chthoniobacterales bacterium]|jgi:hydroxymethylglutaryl-CoA lyase|nr:hydroxymethylglutaryl-CoA lyase [Chthoniobacterales bacterium]
MEGRASSRPANAYGKTALAIRVIAMTLLNLRAAFSSMPNDTVQLIECPRDAWQGLKRQIPTEIKVEYLRALIGAGFKHIDAVSFVSAKAVPQMADSEMVLEQLDPPDDVEIIGIGVNEKGADRAIATGAVTTLGYPFSISETFLRKNQNQSLQENYKVLETIKNRAEVARLNVVVYISMAFGNPYGDPWNEEKVGQAVGKIAGLEIRSISLADTVGIATAELIGRVMAAVVRDYGAHDIGVHMHSTRAGAAAKVLAAYDAGCRRFDAAIGGMGGCPFAQDALVGNIPTEVVLEALEQRGVTLPIKERLDSIMAMNGDISSKFSAE